MPIKVVHSSKSCLHMKHLLLIPFLILTTITFAQQGVITGGGNATGSGGSASYTVGQVAWNMFTGTNGSVLQGIQQPYEISIISGIDDFDVSLNYVVYPNPTNGAVTLDIGNTNLEGLKYQLYSISGVLLQEKRIDAIESEIHLENYSSSTYFLRVLKDKIVIKLFKIVKN